MLDCKELAGKESAEKYELNCKRKSKKKKAWERMLCAKKAWVNRLTTEKKRGKITVQHCIEGVKLWYPPEKRYGMRLTRWNVPSYNWAREMGIQVTIRYVPRCHVPVPSLMAPMAASLKARSLESTPWAAPKVFIQSLIFQATQYLDANS